MNFKKKHPKMTRFGRISNVFEDLENNELVLSSVEKNFAQILFHKISDKLNFYSSQKSVRQ